MIEKFEGIVLRTIKHSDNLMIADVYTRQAGRRQFLLPVSKSKKSRVRSVLFQPLSMLSFNATVRATGHLGRISDAASYSPYQSVPYDVVKSSIALYLSEVLTHALREEEADEGLFTFLHRSFMWFDAATCGYADFHLVFMARLLRFLGISPNMDNVSRNLFFDMQSGCLVSEQPLHSFFLTPADTARFLQLLSADFLSVSSMALNREQRGEFLAVLEEYYRLHVPSFPHLRSSEVLREIFG